MSIEVTCVQCGTVHRVNDRLAGRRVRCSQCQTVVHVPELDQPVPVSPSAEAGSIEIEATASDASQPMTAATVPKGTVNLASPDDVKPTSVAEPGQVEDPDEDDEVLPRKKREEEELDMTPMVDVTFLLLIFFMVTAAFSLQKSINMPRQQTDAPSTTVVEDEEDKLDLLEMEVDEFGGFLVLAPDGDIETPGKQNLVKALKSVIGANDGPMRLVIKVHEMAKLRALVDAMDAGTIAGYPEMEVTQVEDFD